MYRKPLHVNGYFGNSVDPDKMPHNAMGLQCLLSQNQSSENEIQYCFEIITCDPSLYTTDHSDLIVSNFIVNSIGTQNRLVLTCTIWNIFQIKGFWVVILCFIQLLISKTLIRRI